MAHRPLIDSRVDFTSRSVYYPELARPSADPALAEAVRAYAAQHLAEGSRRSAEETIAYITQRAGIRANRLTELEAWLKAHAPPAQG